jgi:hypothetical protein
MVDAMVDAMDDATLKGLLAADRPPASDPRFVIAVMARIEQRRFLRELTMTAGLAVCAMALLALLAPALEITWRDSLAPYANNVVIALVLTSITLAVPYFFNTSQE